MEDVRHYDEAMVRQERGESEALPWEQSEREIEAEREEIRRGGEL